MAKIIGIDLGTTNSVVAVMEGGDPTGLIGLPLIRLTRMLEAAGIAVL